MCSQACQAHGTLRPPLRGNETASSDVSRHPLEGRRRARRARYFRVAGVGGSLALSELRTIYVPYQEFSRGRGRLGRSREPRLEGRRRAAAPRSGYLSGTTGFGRGERVGHGRPRSRHVPFGTSAWSRYVRVAGVGGSLGPAGVTHDISDLSRILTWPRPSRHVSRTSARGSPSEPAAQRSVSCQTSSEDRQAAQRPEARANLALQKLLGHQSELA